MNTNDITTSVLPAVSRLRSLPAFCWQKLKELFRFLPIKLKLSLIIGLVVFIVLAVFSIFVVQNQKKIVRQGMDYVGMVLLQALSETAKGDIMLDKSDRLREAALRLIKKNGQGMQKIAIFDRKGEVIVAFDAEGQSLDLQGINLPSTKDVFAAVEQADEFQYFYRIITQLSENGIRKDIYLGTVFLTFSKAEVLASVNRSRDIAIGSAMLILALAVLGILLTAGRMVKQIHILSDAARKVGNGELDVHIKASSKDELGELADEFNKMVQHLREKNQMQKFVSPLTVDMIRNSVRKPGDPDKAAKRQVAVLFSDARKFSTIAEQLAPETIVRLVNIYFEIQTRIVERHNGVVDKFMGDQIMAIFQGEQMANNALTSAVEIQRRIKNLNQERRAKKLLTLEVGIGINSGDAVLGNMGSSNRMDYTVIGDVVNVASRLCDSASAGQIIASFDLAKKGNGSYPTSRLKSVQVKGRIKSIEVCEVDYDRDILT